MDRRTFLRGTAALFCAPALVKAENLMPIQVPRREILLLNPSPDAPFAGVGDNLFWHDGHLMEIRRHDLSRRGDAIKREIVLMVHDMDNGIPALPQAKQPFRIMKKTWVVPSPVPGESVSSALVESTYQEAKKLRELASDYHYIQDRENWRNHVQPTTLKFADKLYGTKNHGKT